MNAEEHIPPRTSSDVIRELLSRPFTTEEIEAAQQRVHEKVEEKRKLDSIKMPAFALFLMLIFVTLKIKVSTNQEKKEAARHKKKLYEKKLRQIRGIPERPQSFADNIKLNLTSEEISQIGAIALQRDLERQSHVSKKI